VLNALGYADDLILAAGDTIQLQEHIKKVEAFCTWSGMALASSKCDASGILHGTAGKPTDWSVLEPILQRITINSKPVGLIKPYRPFRYLGVDITLTLYWKYQYRKAIAVIQDLGEGLAVSPAGKRLTIEMKQSCVLLALLYPCCLAPYTERRLHILDLIRGRVIKKILRLPSTMSTAVLYLPDNKLGFKMKSIVPAHAQMAAESLIHSLEDKGKLGTLTRALTARHLQTRRRAGETPSLTKPRETWLTRMPAAMSLRKAAWVSKLDMQVDMPRQAYSLAASRADLWEIVQDCNRLHNVHADMCVSHEYILEPLWKPKIFDLEQICDAGAKPSIMDWTTFQRSHPRAGDVQKRALWLLTAMMCDCSCDLADKIATYRAVGYTQSSAAERILPDIFAPRAAAPMATALPTTATTAPGTVAPAATHAATAPAAARPRARRPAGTHSAREMHSLVGLLQVDSILGHSGSIMQNDLQYTLSDGARHAC